MASKLAIQRVLTLPQTLQASTLYIVRSSNASEVELYFTSETGTELRRVPNTSDIQELIKQYLRESLTEDRIYYISPTGNDNNDGLTEQTAWASIQYAVDYIATYIDLNGFGFTIQLANGIYEPITLRTITGYGQNSFANIQGNADDNTLVTIRNPGNQNCVQCWSSSTAWSFYDLTIDSTAESVSGSSFWLQNALIVLNNVNFGYAADAQVRVIGGMTYLNNCTISNGAKQHLYLAANACVYVGGDYTLLNTPNFTDAFLKMDSGTTIRFSFAGVRNQLFSQKEKEEIVYANATGRKYYIESDAAVYFYSGRWTTEDDLPGDIAGYREKTLGIELSNMQW